MDRSSQTSSKKSGGGVLMAVRNNFPSSSLVTSFDSVEQLLVTITLPSGLKTLLGVAYIPPDAPVSSYEAYSSAFEEVSTFGSFSHVLLMGDLNLPGVDWSGLTQCIPNQGAVRTTYDLVSTYNLNQVNNVENERGVTLDVVFSSEPDVSVSKDADPLVAEDCHHPALCISMPSSSASHSTPKLVYNFKRCDLESVFQELHNKRIEASHQFSPASDVNSMFSDFVNVIKTSVLRHTPMIKVGSSFPPWFSRDLKKLVNEKKRLHAQYKRTLNDGSYLLFAVFLDFSKAFDRVNHSLLLSKLSLCGIHGPMLSWFSTYLQDRRLIVRFASSTSKDFIATSGVPQGSNLGPVLFNIFINDISAAINVKHLIFADDIKLYLPMVSPNDFNVLQESLIAVERWCEDNCMTLNSSMCVVMTFHRIHSPQLYEYTLGGNSLKRVYEFRDLGVLCSHTLSPEQHVNRVCTKASKNLGLIIRYSRIFSSPLVLKTLNCHLVRSHLEYCSVVWSPHQRYLQEKIQSIQNRFVRLVGLRLGYRYLEVPVSNLEAEIGLQPLAARRKIYDLMFLYRIVNSEVQCPELLEQIKFHIPAGTRSRELFARVHHATSYVQHSTMSRIQATGNSLPQEIDIFNCSAQQFRRKIVTLQTTIME